MPAFGVPEGSSAHHCWIFDEPAEFHSRVRSFLAEGLHRNERVWYVGEGTEDVLLGHVGAIGFDDAVARGAARVVPLSEAYADVDARRPQDRVRTFAEVLEQSLAEGYSGMRVAADTTSLVADSSWCRYEHLVDRFMIGRPLSGLCGFDGRRLDPATVAELECLHPVTNTTTASFRLTACSRAADRFALTGELDFTNLDLLVRVLDAADPQPSEGRVMIEMRGLAFVDHRSLMALARYAADRDAELVLLDPRHGARQLAELLGDTTIRTEVSR